MIPATKDIFFTAFRPIKCSFSLFCNHQIRINKIYLYLYVQSNVGDVTKTWSKGKTAIAKPENPKIITAKEVDLKLFAFIDEMNEFCQEMHRQLNLILNLLNDSFADWAEASSTH